MNEMIKEKITKIILSQVSEISDCHVEDIESSDSFISFGIHSTQTLELVRRLNKILGIEMGVEAVFDYPEIFKLSTYIYEEYGNALKKNSGGSGENSVTETEKPVSQDPYPTVVHPPPVEAFGDTEIAVIGLSLRLPEARTLDKYFSNLINGDCCVHEVDTEFWKENRYAESVYNPSNTPEFKYGALLPDIDQFDTVFFNISPREAEMMDPQQRLFMEEGFNAFENSGYCKEVLSRLKVGIFAGCRASDYLNNALRKTGASSHLFLGNDMAILPARLSYFLDLKGPSIAVDTACSSSLVAIHLACESICRGESDMALAGGVFVMSSPGFYDMAFRTGLLSKSGKCKAFDQSADGITLAEGVCAVILKKAQRAVRDNDHIYGIIKASGVNQDGCTKGITAPSSLRQRQLLQAVITQSGVPVESIGYVEAHGSGTHLGDPIEIRALTETFKSFTDKRQFCVVGSHKANIGHSIMTAGLAGFIKILACMKHGQLPPSVNIEQLNEHISLEESPFYILDRKKDWQKTGSYPLRAAVSSFGLSGTNCHIILEEPGSVCTPPLNAAAPYYLVPISAKSASDLRQKLTDLKEWIHREKERYHIRDMAYTLQVGRSQYKYRTGFVVDGYDSALEKISDMLERDDAASPEPERGSGNHPKKPPEELIMHHRDIVGNGLTSKENGSDSYKKLLEDFLGAFLQGEILDFQSLHGDNQCCRVPLPAYPFNGKRHWFCKGGRENAPGTGISKLRINPPCGFTEEKNSRGRKKVVLQQANPRQGEAKKTNASQSRMHPVKKRENAGMKLEVIEILASLLHLQPSEIEPDKAFLDIGLDSVIGVEFIKKINERFHINLKTSKLYEYPSIERLATCILNREDPPEPEDAPETCRDIEADVIKILAGILNTAPSQVDRDRSFLELGLDSVIGVEFINELNKVCSTDTKVAQLYEYPSVALFSRNFANSLQNEVRKNETGRVREQDTGMPEAPADNRTQPVPPAHPGKKTVPSSRGLVLDCAGRPEDIRIQAFDIPEPEADEVQIMTRAAAINFGDLLCIQGLYPTQPQYPFIPGFQVSGVVLKTGAWVKNYKPGDHVIAMTWSRLGGICDTVNACEELVVKKPQHISFIDACSYPDVFLTAYHALYDIGRIRENDHVLIQSAAGGIGLMAVQLAKLKKAVVYGTSSSEEKLAFLKGAGVDCVLNYQSPDFQEQVLETSGNRGVDIVLNTLSGDYVHKGIRCLAPGGRYLELAVGGTNLAAEIPLNSLVNNISFNCIDIRKLMLEDRSWAGRYLGIMVGMIQDSTLCSNVSKVFPFEKADQAFKFLKDRKSTGKIVLKFDGDASMGTVLPPGTPKETPPRAYHIRGDIAVIGVSGRFPGADSLDRFWHNLEKGVVSIRDIPPERWAFGFGSADEGRSFCRRGGILEDIDKFDAAFFKISPSEAGEMDPQQRLFLEESWKALEDAGYTNAPSDGLKCGVFAGVASGDYSLGIRNSRRELTAHTLIGNSSSILASRISYLLNLSGPCMAIDTACSSSLVSIHTACRSIAGGECEMAVAGGVNINTTPDMHLMIGKMGILSPDGYCRTFDENSNGWVIGEGVGAVVLKSLENALKDNDNIYCVIKASGVNQNGFSNGLTAPKAGAQSCLQSAVYKQADIDPATISYIEVQGTSSKTGDSLEVGGLMEAFRTAAPQRRICGLGSLKPNVGHSLTASGVCALIKIILAFRHKKIPMTPLVSNVNSDIDVENSPFYIATKTEEWRKGSTPRRAAINSFGFSGTNCHIVLEEPPHRQSRQAGPPAPYYLIPLSAKTRAALERKLTDMLDWLDKNRDAVDIRDVSYTLLTKRTHFRVRCCLYARNLRDLADKITHSVDNGTLFVRDVKKEKNVMDSQLVEKGESAIREMSIPPYPVADVYKKNISLLMELYMNGYSPGWEELFYSGSQTVSLPPYPFSGERFWIRQGRGTGENSPAPSERAGRGQGCRELETPGNGLRSFASCLDKGAFYLRDHVVFTQNILPGAACLELIRTAAEATGRKRNFSIKDIVWASPIVASKNKEDVFIHTMDRRDFAEFQITTREHGGKVNLHARGKWIHEPVARGNGRTAGNSHRDIKSLTVKCTGFLAGDACYRVFWNMGLNYGPSFQLIEHIIYNDREALCLLREHGYPTSGSRGFTLLPSIVDAALQASVVQIMGAGRAKNRAYLPFAMERVEFSDSLDDARYSYVERPRAGESKNDTIMIPLVEILSSTGSPLVRFKNISFRPFTPAGRNAIQPHAAPARGGDSAGDIESYLLGLCANVLETNKQFLDIDEDLAEFGMNSVMIIGFLNTLEEHFGGTIEPNAISDCRTIRKLSAYLHKEFNEKSGNPAFPRIIETKSDPRTLHLLWPETFGCENQNNNTRSAGNMQPDRKAGDKKIAVVGMSCRYPGSNGPEAFWSNLRDGKNLITQTPESRKRYLSAHAIDGEMNLRWGGFIDHPDRFDYGFFHVKKTDAVIMDPCHRILLELSQDLWDDAGYTLPEIAGNNVGVFVGGGESSYVKLNKDRLTRKHMKSILVNMIQNFMAARISDFYDLKGPSLTIDTACSSSLVAVHEACQCIIRGEADMAVAGGVELLIDPLLINGFAEAGILTEKGICSVFDEKADGIVLGEGAGLVLLKPYEDALRDGDRIYGAITGSAVNNDGQTMGATVPDIRGQKDVIRRALAQSGISPSGISYIEAHGTGTLLGDPIEIRALSQVYADFTEKKQYCAIGSVKTNIGHLLRAAGTASLIKVLLALKEKTIPMTLNCSTPHPRFQFDESPFYPMLETGEWKAVNGIRRAAVSSFGFGGTNCHVIVEEPGYNNYSPRKHPLPKRKFDSRPCWIGENPFEEAGEPDAFNPEFYDELLKDLEAGALSLESCVAAISKRIPVNHPA